MNSALSLIDPAQATRIVRRCPDVSADVTAVTPMHGGMVYHVLEWTLAGGAGAIVAKAHPEADHRSLFDEHDALAWYTRETRFPVPRPLACVSGDFGTCLLMERVPGRNMEAARLSPGGRDRLMTQLADHVAHLHSHHRSTYGSALRDEPAARWLDLFAPRFSAEFTAVGGQLSARTQWVVRELLANLERWLPEAGEPTMVHGDLWETNIIVGDAEPDQPVIRAFIDVRAEYSDVEFELAYLRLFRTGDRLFMDHYARTHPLRPGFGRRCRVYWLYFMLLHVRLFGPTYLKNCEALARQVEALAS